MLQAWEQHSVAEHEDLVRLLSGRVRRRRHTPPEVHWSFAVQERFIHAYYFAGPARGGVMANGLVSTVQRFSLTTARACAHGVHKGCPCPAPGATTREPVATPGVRSPAPVACGAGLQRGGAGEPRRRGALGRRRGGVPDRRAAGRRRDDGHRNAGADAPARPHLLRRVRRRRDLLRRRNRSCRPRSSPTRCAPSGPRTCTPRSTRAGSRAGTSCANAAAHASLVLYDLKLMDDGRHAAGDGRVEPPILQNLVTLAHCHANVWIRIP